MIDQDVEEPGESRDKGQPGKTPYKKTDARRAENLLIFFASCN